MIIPVKIYKGLAGSLLRQRVQCGEHSKDKPYMVNRIVKIYDTFIALKTLTTSGHIQNYIGQLDLILERCKVSRSTLYSRLSELEKMSLVTREKSGSSIRLVLKSWKQIADELLINLDEYYIIKYDLNKPEQRIEYHLRDVEFEEAADKQKLGLTSTLSKIPNKDNIYALLVFHGADQSRLHELDYFCECLKNIQQKLFVSGTDRRDALFNLNPVIARSAHTIRTAHGLKCKLSVKYLKHQLSSRGFRTFLQPKAVVSEKRSHLPDDLYTVKYEAGKPGKWDDLGVTVWHLPHLPSSSKSISEKRLKINPSLPLIQKLNSTNVA